MKTIHTNRYRRLINLLIEARDKAKLTQEQVAKALGRSQSHVASIESGGRRLDIVELIDLCAVLKLDPVRVLKEIASVAEN